MVNTKSKTKKKKQASGTRVGSSEDLLTEIFIRLRVTSIVRFKSVSKHWLLLLTNRDFTHRYDYKNLSKSVGLFGRNNMYVPFDVENRSTPPFRSLDSYFNLSNVRIEQSCNGLLLCSAVHNGATEYYVFNPTTKQLAIIPPVHKYILTMALVFQQTNCVHYKVVCICALTKDYQVQVYSSDTKTWKICIKNFYVHNLILRDPVYWNGAVYWPPYHRSGNWLFYKLDVEQLHTLPMPEGLASDEISTMYFGESRDHLHLIFIKDRTNNILRLSVYEMLRDHSGWFVKYRLQLDGFPGAYPKMIFQYQYSSLFVEVIDVVRGKEEEDTFLVLLTPGKIIRYNVHNKSFKELSSYILGAVNTREKVPRFYRYIETLSSF